MNNRLEGEGIFEEIDKELDAIKLLKLIKIISYAYESKSYPFLYVKYAIEEFYESYQQTTTSCDSYMDSITHLHNVIVHCSGNLGD